MSNKAVSYNSSSRIQPGPRTPYSLPWNHKREFTYPDYIKPLCVKPQVLMKHRLVVFEDGKEVMTLDYRLNVTHTRGLQCLLRSFDCHRRENPSKKVSGKLYYWKPGYSTCWQYSKDV
jgi:hypothetical protein